MDPRERFLQAAVEPLADNSELQLAARQQLDAELSSEATAEDLANSAERLERSGSGRWRWRWVWSVVVLVVSVVMMAGPVKSLVAGWLEARGLMNPFGVIGFEPRLSFRESLTEEDRLLLFGNDAAVNTAEQWRPLWDSDSGNVMFYVEYVRGYRSHHDALPPDFMATGKELDPENGWFALKAAAINADEVVDKESVSYRERRAGKKRVWVVKDVPELARRIALLKDGALAEKNTAYHAELMELRFSRLPQPREFTEFIPLVAYLATSPSLDMDEQRLAGLFSAEAQRCAREHDEEGFRELAVAWQRLRATRLEEADTLVDALVVGVAFGASLPEMRDAASALDVDADVWASRAESWQARRDELRTASDAELEERVMRHGSMMSSLALPMISRQVQEPPPVSRSDLLPALMVEQALLARVAAGAAWLLLGFFGLVSMLVGRSQAPLTRRSVKALGRMLELKDALWIGAGGVVVPVVVYLLMRCATPLGRLDWGPELTLYAVPIAHFVGLLIMWIVWPLAIADWRSAKVGKMFHWKIRWWWMASAMIAPLAGMLCFSFAVPPGSWSIPLALAGIFFGAWSLIWWLVDGGFSIWGRWGTRVRRQMIAQAARPAWLAAMMLSAGLVVFFLAEERRWFARDELNRLSPSFTAYEAKVTEQLKRELREVLE